MPPKTHTKKRKTSQVLWGTLYAMIIACTGLLGYLGFAVPEASLAGQPADVRVPASERATPQPATPAEPKQAIPAPFADPEPKTEAAGATFFGLPVN